jgi:serine phosphatase RsbU (regulator of sigma subunit)
MHQESQVADIQDYALDIFDTVREPLLMLDASLRVRSANRSFYHAFHVSPDETEGRLIYELGNGQWNSADLRTLLEDVVPKCSVFNDFELEHTFPAIGRRVMLLNARKLQAGHHGELLVLAIEDVTERRRLWLELEDHSRHLELAHERLKLDLEFAHEVQRGLLPQRLPKVPGYEFFAHYEPAFEVGGDYYDFIPQPRQRLAVLLGDVAGKGVAAALLMAKLSADARFCMLTEPDPAAAITNLNSLMTQSGPADRFVTLTTAVLDYSSHAVTLVNAGNPSPLIYHRATCTVEEAISHEAGGLPLGVLDDFQYGSCQVSLEPGDCILAFTDGVTEAMDVNHVQLQTKRVHAALHGEAFSPRTLGERVVEVVKQFAAGRSQHDDIALVGFGRTS